MLGGKSWSLGAWCLVCRFFEKLQKQLLVVGEMPGHGDCSPRMRGWTVHDLVALGHEVLPPAHAGMDIQLESVPGQPATASRIHGDGLEGISGA